MVFTGPGRTLDAPGGELMLGELRLNVTGIRLKLYPYDMKKFHKKNKNSDRDLINNNLINRQKSGDFY